MTATAIANINTAVLSSLRSFVVRRARNEVSLGR